MEVPRDRVVYGGKMLAVISFPPWRGRVRLGREGQQQEEQLLLCCVSRGKDDPPHTGYAAALG